MKRIIFGRFQLSFLMLIFCVCNTVTAQIDRGVKNTKVERKIALVIGNTNYDNSIESPVKNPEQPIPKKAIEPSKKTSLGVSYGKAVSLPQPQYPDPARAVCAYGVVKIRIEIDETGKVISAKAIDGHPLLRKAAEDAALRAVYSSTLLSGVPTKVSSEINYNFAESDNCRRTREKNQNQS